MTRVLYFCLFEVVLGSLKMLTLSIQVGFGKGTASKQVWLDGIDPNITEPQLERNVSKYGKVRGII